MCQIPSLWALNLKSWLSNFNPKSGKLLRSHWWILQKNDELIVMLFHPNLTSQSKAGHVNLYRFYLRSLGLKNYTENHHERNEWKLFPWTISGIADVYSYRPWRIFLLSFNRELMKRAPCPLLAITWFGTWIFTFWIKSQILTKLNLKIQISYHTGRSQIDDHQI